MLPNRTVCLLVGEEASVCIWVCYSMPRRVPKFVGKTFAKKKDGHKHSRQDLSIRDKPIATKSATAPIIIASS